MLPNDKKLLASLYASPMFSALDRYIQERINIIRSQPVKKETEFETLIQVGVSEGRRAELQELLQALKDIYRNSKEK